MSALQAGGVRNDPDRKLILIGLDAADERLIAEGVAAGRLPSFARMIHEGVSGPLRTHRPILSPILWTTMATGLTPDRHGVLDFVEQDSSGRTRPVTSRSVLAPSFWTILGRRNVTCGVVGWLATYPAEHVRGFMITDRFTVHPFDEDSAAVPPAAQRRARRDDLGDAAMTAAVDATGKTFPPELYASLRGTIVDPSSIRDEDLARVFGSPVIKGSDDAKERRELCVIEAVARTYTEAALGADAREHPQLLAVYFEAIDRLMHLFGDAMPPALPGVSRTRAERYGRTIERFYAAMDARLGRFMQAAGPNGTVIVVSDHGFKIGDERPRHTASRSDVFAAEWHRDPGVVLAWGRGVRRGARLEGADVYDVAPTVLAFFGVPASEGMRGRALTDLFQEGFLPPPPPRVASYDKDVHSENVGSAPRGAGKNATAHEETLGDRSASARSSDGETARSQEEKEILENLIQLGYVDGGAGAGARVSTRATANLASFYLEEKRFDQAISLYKQVLEKDPADLTALYNIGYAYKGLGSSAKAAECFERVLRSRPDYTEARLVLSDCYVSLGRVGEALSLLRAGGESSRRDPGFQNHLGTVLASAGRFEEASAALERSIALRPSEASPYLNLARILEARGKRDEAIRALERARRAAPEDPRIPQRLREMEGRPAASK